MYHYARRTTNPNSMSSLLPNPTTITATTISTTTITTATTIATPTQEKIGNSIERSGGQRANGWEGGKPKAA